MADLYLLIVVGGIEPMIKGPFLNEERRDTVAKVYRNDDEWHDEDGIFMLTVKDGKPEVDTYSGGFFDN